MEHLLILQDQVSKVQYFARYVRCPGEGRKFLKCGKFWTKGQRRGLKIYAFVGSALWIAPYPDLICVSLTFCVILTN